MKNKFFYFVCGFLFLVSILFLLNLWYKFIPLSYVDKYVVLLLFTAMGLLLLPFADKIKIGNFLEIERLKDKIEEIQLTQYLGEIIKSPQGDIFYFDNDGRHTLPDNETSTFLRTNKGEIPVSGQTFAKMKSSDPIDSIKAAEKVKWGKHIFVILNNKKYWMDVTNLADSGVTENQIEKFRSINDHDIKLIPTGK